MPRKQQAGEHPILFSGEMVRAIFEGRKTQTRRVVRPQPPKNCAYLCGNPGNGWAWTDGSTVDYDYFPKDKEGVECTYGVPGNRLWVREAWWAVEVEGQGVGQQFIVFADEWSGTPREPQPLILRPTGGRFKWGNHAAFHLPRWASRITLEITDVRVQRVQDISEEDALAEGVDVGFLGAGLYWQGGGTMIDERNPIFDASKALSGTRGAFGMLWDSINAKRGYGWISNPWVWVICFKTVQAVSNAT